MPEKAATIEKKLKGLGLSKDAIQAAWPIWWSEEAEFSPSALNELRFSLSRKLGISPESLFDEGNAKFLWEGDARFKGLSAESQSEKTALVSFGSSIGRLLIQGTNPPSYRLSVNTTGEELRSVILQAGAPSVRLPDLLALSWSVGIPVIQLRVFPLTSKRMAAMAIRNGKRFVILIGRDATYPAPIAYYVAHELGHIFRRHLSGSSAIVDLSMPDETHDRDREEIGADHFGLSLLTGRSNPEISTTRAPNNARELANAVVKAGRREKIEPGTLALCYAHKTGDWKLAQNALRYIYSAPKPAWREVNRFAQSQLSLGQLTQDNLSFLSSVMGLKLDANRSGR